MKPRVSRFFKIFDIFDLLAFLGLMALGGGLWGYDHRISLIIVGAIVVFIGVKGARSGDS